MSPQKFILSFSHKILDICEERNISSFPNLVQIIVVFADLCYNTSDNKPCCGAIWGYGRWYYGHGHVYGCEFGGNRGDGYD